MLKIDGLSIVWLLNVSSKAHMLKGLFPGQHFQEVVEPTQGGSIYGRT